MSDRSSPGASQPRAARRLTLATADPGVRVEVAIRWRRPGWPTAAAARLEQLAAAVRGLDDRPAPTTPPLPKTRR